MFSRRTLRTAVAIFLASTLLGCTSHPPGESDLRMQAKDAGTPYTKPVPGRNLPPLSANPSLQETVDYAFAASADLENQYWLWQSAIEQIPQDGSQTSTLNLAAGTSITHGRTSLSNTTIAGSNDPMTDIKWPGKLDVAARQALEIARAAGQRFYKARFDLREKVIGAYTDYALQAELIRLAKQDAADLKTAAQNTQTRSENGGASQQDVLRAQSDLAMAQNNLQMLEAQMPALQAALNALLCRPPGAPFAPPASFPAQGPLPMSEHDLLALGASRNPELHAQATEIQARLQAIRQAKLQYVPDFNFSAGTDLAGITQTIIGQATVPVFRYEAIDAAIVQAKDNLHSSEALRRQAGNDLATQLVTNLVNIEDDDRQIALFDQTLVPSAKVQEQLNRTGYVTGHATLLDLIAAERSVIDLQNQLARLRSARIKAFAQVESLVAIDFSQDARSDQRQVTRADNPS
jgi:outer membrane protein, heavy metal efflux system